MNESCGWKDKSLSIGLLVLRILMGGTIANIGYMKIFGGGLEMLKGGLTSMGFPMVNLLAWLAALSEFAGGILIVLGLGTRVAAFFVFFTMCVAFFVAHANDPFNVRMPAYLYGTIALGLILTGGGKYSLDSVVCCRKKSSPENVA